MIFPTDTATDFISSVTSTLSSNIGPVLSIFAFFVGLNLILRLLRRSSRGRV